MRDYKDNLFYYESGEKANPLEKNTVHAFVKTLADGDDRLTSAFFDLCGIEDASEVSFQYRTEVSEKNSKPLDGERRALVGISRTGGVREGGETGDTSHIDARIRAVDLNGDAIASVFVEAKAGKADLTEGQLSDYAEDFHTTEQHDGVRWSTIEWADVYRIFQDMELESPCKGEPTVSEYLTSQFNSRLLQKGMVHGTLGESQVGGDDGRRFRKRLLIGPPEPGADPVLSFWGFSRNDGKANQSATMEVPEETFVDLFGALDVETRHEVFIEGNLQALRDWLETNEGVTESHYAGDGHTFARAAREGYSEPGGIMLRLTEHSHFKINSYNVTRSNGWVYHPPILADDEWKTVFQGMAERLGDERSEEFIQTFDFDVLWDAYLKRSN